MDDFKRFLDDLVFWLDKKHDIDASCTIDGTTAYVILLLDGESFYVGSFIDPGITVSWLGPHVLDRESSDDLVRVNGIVMSAIGRQVAGWVAGYQ